MPGTELGLKPELNPRSEPMTGLKLIRLRWRRVLLFGVGGLAAAVVYLLCAPKWYEAEIMIVPKSQTDTFAVQALAGNLPFDLGGMTSLATSDSERISAVLASRSVTDAVIKKFGLMERYDVDKIEKARRKLWKLCSSTVEKKPDIVKLTCEDKEPRVARDLASSFGKVADSHFRRIALSSAREGRAFLETRLQQAKRDLEETSQALRRFQEANSVIDLAEQGKAVVSGIASLEADLVAKRIELAYARGFASENEASVVQLRRQISVIEHELRLLEERRTAPAAGAEATAASADKKRLFPPALELPRLGAAYEALVREHKIREKVFLMLTERFEALKMDEARDLSSFVVFDDAALPTYRVRPTGKVLPLGLFLGLMVGSLIVLVPGWWADLRRRALLERAPVHPS